MKFKEIAWLAGIGVFAFIVYLPVFIWLFDVWMTDPAFGHGFLILPISAFIVWLKRKELDQGNPSPLGIPLIVLGLALYVWGYLETMRFLAAISLLPVLVGLALYLGGNKSARALAFPITFLVFMIPPPFLDELSRFMQTLTTHSSADILDAMGISVSTIGSQIHLPQSTFTVGQACSGMSTLISLLALAALVAYILKGTTWVRVSLFIIAIPIAILANTIRIVSLLIIGHHWGAEAAMTYFHDYSSLVFYIISLLFLWITARFLGCQLIT